MKCPFCGHADDRVLDTRVQKDGSIRRRRECLECKARFSTVETIMLALPYIIKKDGRREPFSKEKILKGLSASTQKRPVSVAQIDAVVERIAAWVINRGESEVSSRLLGKKSHGRAEATRRRCLHPFCERLSYLQRRPGVC